MCEGDAPARCRYAGAQCAPLRGGRSVWRAGVVAQASLSCRCTAIHLLAPYGVAVVPLTLIWQAGGSRKVSLTLTRAARPEGKGVIRKRGETIGVSPLVRLPRAAALSARDARAHRARRGRGSEPGAPSRGPGQLLLPLRGNSPSRALRNRAAIHLPAPLRTQWHRPTGAQCAPPQGINSRRCAEIVVPYRVQKVDGALLPAEDALQRKKRQPKLSLFYVVITAYLRAIAFLAASTM